MAPPARLRNLIMVRLLYITLFLVLIGNLSGCVWDGYDRGYEGNGRDREYRGHRERERDYGEHRDRDYREHRDEGYSGDRPGDYRDYEHH